MSVRVMSWVWEHSPAKGSGLLLLLAIADFADDEGFAFPSIDTLKDKTRTSRSTVFRGLEALTEAGHLKIESRGTGRNTSRYQIVMSSPSGVTSTPQGSQTETTKGPNLTPLGSQPDAPGVAERHPWGVTVDTPGVSLLTHRTIIEPKTSTTSSSADAADGTRAPTRRAKPRAPKTATAEIPDGFDAFWSAYPKKVGKPEAIKAYIKAIKNGATPAEILDGARLYALDCRLIQDPHYIKHPSGWLNAERWADERTPTLPLDDTPPPPPWCGECDPDTRRFEDADRPYQCPECHPAARKAPTP